MKDKEKVKDRDMELLKCKRCMGKGGITKTNFMKGATSQITCPDCGGVGYRTKDTGISIRPISGDPMYVVHTVKKQDVAWIRIDLEFVLGRSKKKRYGIASIVSMKTMEGFRCKGYMGKMIEMLKNTGGGAIHAIRTSWNDSTEGGKEFLLKRGFKHKGMVLIWERDVDTKENEGEEKQPK